MAKGKNQRSIVIRREEVVEGGHHGGAWKVAYADFVTAMMAFFLLMWLLNATTEEQRKGLADYFSPTNLLSHSSSGTGKPFGGRTPFAQGTMLSDRGTVQVVVGPHPPSTEDAEEEEDSDNASATHSGGGGPATGPGTGASLSGGKAGLAETGDVAGQAAAGTRSAGRSLTGQAASGLAASGPASVAYTGSDSLDRPRSAAPARPDTAARAPTEAEILAEQAQRERKAFEQAAQQIQEVVHADPALADLARQLVIDTTPEGLRIQILDEDRRPMFATGSASPNDRARMLLQKITPVLQKLPEDLSIAGHTDSAPYKGVDRTNWELSADRANGMRRLLVESGFPEMRIRSVTGNADRDPLIPNDPTAAANRRIAIVVLRSVPAPVPAPIPVAPAAAASPSGK